MHAIEVTLTSNRKDNIFDHSSTIKIKRNDGIKKST